MAGPGQPIKAQWNGGFMSGGGLAVRGQSHQQDVETIVDHGPGPGRGQFAGRGISTISALAPVVSDRIWCHPVEPGPWGRTKIEVR